MTIQFQLSCCSTVDMPLSYLKKRDISYVCFHFNLNGVQYDDDFGQTIALTEFYDKIKAGSLPTTSQVSVGEFEQFFETFLKAGKDIMHISFSSGLSGSYNAARIAKEGLDKKYPNRKIILIDSLSASSGYGLLLDAAADMRDAGVPIEDIASWVDKSKLQLNHWFFSGDLSHYKRGGRISASAAIVGTMLSICPLMNMNNKGELIPQRNVHGKKAVMREIVKEMGSHAIDKKDYSGKCFISQSACHEDATKVAEIIEAGFPHLNGKVMINNIGTVIGAHTGPGTVAVFFFGDEREK